VTAAASNCHLAAAGQRVITALFTDDAQLFKQFQDNQSFRNWLRDTVFAMTYSE
jgi:type I restriction enzyme R subunit